MSTSSGKKSKKASKEVPQGSDDPSSTLEKPEEPKKKKGRSSKGINSQESMTVEVPPSQGDDGKTTFKPEDLNIGTDKLAKQDWVIKGDGTAELQEGSYLDIRGSMIPKEGKTYEISFKLSVNKAKPSEWEKPVSMKARIGDRGKYENMEVDLSKLGKEEKVFRSNFQITGGGKNTANNERTLHFVLYDELKEMKGGLRIHEAIVQEVTAQGSASSSNITVRQLPNCHEAKP